MLIWVLIKTVYKSNSNHPIYQIKGNEKDKKIYFTSLKFKILDQNYLNTNFYSFEIKNLG